MRRCRRSWMRLDRSSPTTTCAACWGGSWRGRRGRRPSLTPAVASAIFKAAIPGLGGAGIDSDYDMAELLKEAPVSMVNSPGSGWAEAVGSISSAYDRHRAIAAVLRPGASPEVVQAALAAA